jgi:hypothetical protein
MNNCLHLDLSKHQRELLLEGLRYIRSSRRYEFREPQAPPDERRDGDLREIAGLISQLDHGVTETVSAER